MANAIDFYFDFSSPYGYLAATRIDALAAQYGRTVNWHPVLLGPAFKATGNTPLVAQPLKGAYSVRDFTRTAKFMNVPFKMPAVFPISTHNAARAFYWLNDFDKPRAIALAKALYRTFFAEGVDIGSPETVVAVAATCGVDGAALLAALGDQAVKDRLKAEVEASLARGVFGSPFVFVDDEPFWGNDRLEQIEAWLKSGGW